jgi:chromosome partitioning protein
MTTLALYSNKGGVGKTAAAVNLSYLAALSGAKTLICDLDPQSSASYYFRVKPKLKAGAKGFIRGGKQI